MVKTESATGILTAIFLLQFSGGTSKEGTCNVYNRGL